MKTKLFQKNIMNKKKNYKIGDRIFFEYISDGSIGEAIVIDIEPRSYKEYDDKKNTYVDINFNMLRTGKHSMIEDYNCISEDDPRVIEYKKTHNDPRIFKEKFENFLKENNFDISQSSIRDYLYKLIS